MSKRRVVVTGLGIVSPLGQNTATTWQNILQGKSGVELINSLVTTEYPVKIAATVKNFDPSPYLSPKEERKFDTFVQYGFVAGMEALEDAGITKENIDPDRVGVAIGSGIGGLEFIEKNHIALLNHGPRKISPHFIPGAIINMLPGYFSIRNGFRGPNISIVSACTTGVHNIAYAARTIAYGDADVMIAGGAEKASCSLGLGGFAACRALSTRNDEPTKASRPWDKNRDGFVLGDGAGVMVLEEYNHAKQRGAKIYAELSGVGMSADAYHVTNPDPETKGVVNAMKKALQDAGLQPEDIDYINAHATATLAGDALELLAIKRTFGQHAYKLAVSSTKSMTGHLLGAAGSVEAIFTVLALQDQVAPPTINLEHPDSECDLDLVPHQAKKMSIRHAISNSFGFGGTNGSLIFSPIS